MAVSSLVGWISSVSNAPLSGAYGIGEGGREGGGVGPWLTQFPSLLHMYTADE